MFEQHVCSFAAKKKNHIIFHIILYINVVLMDQKRNCSVNSPESETEDIQFTGWLLLTGSGAQLPDYSIQIIHYNLDYSFNSTALLHTSVFFF